LVSLGISRQLYVYQTRDCRGIEKVVDLRKMD